MKLSSFRISSTAAKVLPKVLIYTNYYQWDLFLYSTLINCCYCFGTRERWCIGWLSRVGPISKRKSKKSRKSKIFDFLHKYLTRWRKHAFFHWWSFNNYVDKKRGRGVSQKSTLVLECPRGQNPAISESISYYCAM